MPFEEQGNAKEAYKHLCFLGACPKYPSFFFLIYKTTVINLTLFPCNVAKNKVNRYGVNKTEKFVFPSCLGLLYNHHQKQHHLQFVR